MKTTQNMARLMAESEASKRGVPGRDVYDIRQGLEAELALSYPAASEAAATATARGAGKKAVVAAAVQALIDLEDPATVLALTELGRAQSWRQAEAAIAKLGFAGELLARPSSRGLVLPCSGHACPGSWGTNFGLPNVQAVALKLVVRAAALMPTKGDGWSLATA